MGVHVRETPNSTEKKREKMKKDKFHDIQEEDRSSNRTRIRRGAVKVEKPKDTAHFLLANHTQKKSR